MGNELDFSKLSENLDKEIEGVIDAETSKAMDEAVDAIMKANENDDESILDAVEETANLIENEPSEGEEITEETEETSETVETKDSEFIPKVDLSGISFDDDEEDEDDSEKTEDDYLFEDVSSALAEQVEKNLGPSFAELLDEEEGDEPDPVRKKKVKKDDEEGNSGFMSSVPKWLKIVILVLLILVFLGLFLLFTKPGHVVLSRVATSIIMNRVEHEVVPTQSVDPENPGGEVVNPGQPTQAPDVTQGANQPDVTQGPSYIDSDDPQFEEDNSVINILLIGVENIYNDSIGRADSIMVASLDKDGGPVKLVSFMRDLYVEIPGHGDNKLNAAYTYGQGPLLQQTLEKNFGLKTQGYVVVNFDGFEAIVDALGGIDISLTAEEAEYLNTHDYISDPAQRNVVAGNQHMTGNQVLGYCRVRKVNTNSGGYADYGRTERQRIVLKKIFDKYKTKSFTELYSIMLKCLEYVKVPDGVDIEKTFSDCLLYVIENKVFDMDEYRVPFEIDGQRYFNSTKIDGQEVLCFYSENATILHDILYGEKENE